MPLNLHSTFRPLELLQFNPSTLEGNLETLLYLKKKYPTSLPFTIVVADIAFVTKWWKYCLSATTNGKHFYKFIKHNLLRFLFCL